MIDGRSSSKAGGMMDGKAVVIDGEDGNRLSPLPVIIVADVIYVRRSPICPPVTVRDRDGWRWSV